MSMPIFDPHTARRVDEVTGRVTAGGAERERYVAEAGGLDKVQEAAYQQGFLAGHAQGYQEGFQEGVEFGAEAAYRRFEARLEKRDEALLAKIDAKIEQALAR